MRVSLFVLLLVLCLTEQSLLIKNRPRHRTVRTGVSHESGESDESEESAERKGSERRSRLSRRNKQVIVLDHDKIPEPTTKNPLVCKMHYSISEEKVDWFTAKHRCLVTHQQLVSIENKSKLTDVMKAVGVLDGWTWTSGKKLKDGSWIWDSTGGNMDFVENWDKGEPNNLGPKEEGCVDVLPSYKINDLDCDRKDLRYICQKEVCS